MKIQSTEAVSAEYIHLNSCGCQHHTGKDVSLLRPHGRVDYHILYIAKGVCYPTVLGREHTAPEGSLIFFFPGERQEYRFCAQTPTVSYYLHFSGTSLDGMLREIRESGKRVFTVGKSASLETLLARIEEEYTLALPNAAGVTGGYLLAILSLCLRKISFSERETSSAVKKITDVCASMLATLSEGLSVREYAARAHLSESRFTHLFCEVMGKSPVKYLSDARIQKAKELLSYSPLSVLDVAEAVGIKNPYYFSRFFKKHTGEAPSVYRAKRESAEENA